MAIFEVTARNSNEEFCTLITRYARNSTKLHVINISYDKVIIFFCNNIHISHDYVQQNACRTEDASTTFALQKTHCYSNNIMNDFPMFVRT